MVLASIERILGVVFLAMGVLQYAATFVFFRRFEEPAAWFWNGGTTFLLVGALNLLRLRYARIAPALTWVSTAANLVTFAFWIALCVGLTYKFLRYPGAFVGLFLVSAMAAASVVSLVRGRSHA